MAGDSTQLRSAQLDEDERAHLEDVVTGMRDRVEANVRYQLEEYGLDEKPTVRDRSESPSPADAREDDDASPGDERAALLEAIELEAVEGDGWEDAYEQYVTGVGYTVVNRLAALRCMEVREFVDDEVTRFREDGLTPAADRLVTEEFFLEEEAVLEAYRNACDDLAAEIEILFDRSTAYSLIDPDDDTFEDLCGMLDEVPDEVWRADDVLGWVYEYYTAEEMDDLRRKGDYDGLRPMDVPPANQFYTPHWVVRMLTDNSLGRLYLESRGEVDEVVAEQEALSAQERKNREGTATDAGLAGLCTYLVPSDDAGNPPEFDTPEELSVIDPACGSGHFLLYAFDVLERIWRLERPDLERERIPRKILEHNLYGVDLDMRACQLAAFNLYLKARSRAELAGAAEFTLPEINIVCADATVADVRGVADVFDEVADGRDDVRDALRSVLDTFEEVHGLGSLLDVRGTLGELFDDDGGQQLTLSDDFSADHSLRRFLGSLREATSEHRDGDSFLAQDLRSFVKLLDVLARSYDVALMNPPYGSGNRMPDGVQAYVEDRYEYKSEFYINFFEVCERLVTDRGRIGMIVPRTFMFKRTFQDFREDFIGTRGSFDFLAEFGIGVLDKATVRTAGTVVRVNQDQHSSADFYRLHDVDKGNKEGAFLEAAFGTTRGPIQRQYTRDVTVFSEIPGTPLSYWVPDSVRAIYDTDTFFDADNATLDAHSLGDVKQGLATGNNARYLRKFWEVPDYSEWVPFAKGGSDAWILPRMTRTVYWGTDGRDVKRYDGSYPRSEQYYFTEGLTYTNIKEGGRRFGYLHPESIFGTAGQAFLPRASIWHALSYANSHLVTYLVLAVTTGRHWQVGEVSRIPWDDAIGECDELATLAKDLLGSLIGLRRHDFVSPYYTGPLLLRSSTAETEPLLSADHPHRDLVDAVALPDVPSIDRSASIADIGTAAARYRERVRANISARSDEIETRLFDHFDLTEDREDIYREISLRTNQDPGDEPEYDPDAIDTPPEDFDELVEDMLLHLTIQAVRNSSDGIVPQVFDADGPDLLDLIERQFEDVFGETGAEKLTEVDRILGEKRPEDEPYPNVGHWLRNTVFEYQVSRFDNTPVLWKITTENVVPDPAGVGFSCLVDFHQLSPSTFDRLSNRYLEPQKSALRRQRNAANRRRRDESLPPTDRREATTEFERCTSGLEQIAEFEEVVQELVRSEKREWSERDQSTAAALELTVREFRERTQDRLERLDELAAHDDVTMEDLFAPSFYSTVREERHEWISALDDLERACEAYSRNPTEPVEAHQYDQFEYFDSVVGSSHFASNGILCMTYYLEEGSKFLEDGEPRDGLEDDVRLRAELAAGLDEYRELAEEINSDCRRLLERMPSDWKQRALSEITTTGYRPTHKHGVALNLIPLVEHDLVPEIVADKVV